MAVTRGYDPSIDDQRASLPSSSGQPETDSLPRSSGTEPDAVPSPTPLLPSVRRRIYVASSWRNPIQQDIVQALRVAGHEVYDFRNPAPGNTGFAWSEVNAEWLQWPPEQFISDLYAGHPSVERGFAFDKAALDWCDTCVLVLPCGRSAHLEAGYAIGQGKLTLFYLHPQKFEPELMYLLGHGCVTRIDDLLDAVDREESGSERKHSPLTDEANSLKRATTKNET